MADSQCCRIPKRYVVLSMIFIGFANMYYLHSNLGMALVEMTALKNITLENGTVIEKAEFNWTSHQKGLILSSFSYGALLSPIGGVLSGKFGGSTIYSIGILVTAVVTFFSPIFLRYSYAVFVMSNVILGAFETFSYASVTQLVSRWAPPDERAKFVSFGLVGMSLGSGLSFIISGWILINWSWEVLFYVSGIAFFVWYGVWLLVVRNDPSEDNRMSEEEKSYISDKVKYSYNKEKLTYPWKSIFTCMPFWIVCLAKFIMGCGYTFTFMYTPQYIKDMNNIDIEKIGFISMIPQFCAIISAPLSGFVGDFLRSHDLLSVTNIHKTFICTATFGTAIVSGCMVLWPSLAVRIAGISIIQFCITYGLMTILVLFLDLAPRYASLLNSIANVFFTGAGILTPIFVGFIVTSHSMYQWDVCFITLTCICFVIGLLYLIFGSGKERSWANYTSSSKAKERANDVLVSADRAAP